MVCWMGWVGCLGLGGLLLVYYSRETEMDMFMVLELV